MGLFVSEDGHYQSWLSVILCCCAAIDSDESPVELEKAKARAGTRAHLCNEQPLPLAELPATPLPHQNFKADEPIFDDIHHASHVATRPPSIKPLEFDNTSLNPRWSLINRPKTSPTHFKKSSISAPFAFRRLDGSEAQQQSLVPLRLGPVILRESPIPPEIRSPVRDSPSSESTEDLLAQGSRRQSYQQQRDTPFERCLQRNSTIWPLPPPPVMIKDSKDTPAREAPRPAVSSRSSSSSLRRTGGGDASTPSSIYSRPSSERLRPKRKRSLQSLRRSTADADDQDLEKEVMELNTIVEERRLGTARSGTPDAHVAAIAPSMRVRARAETLDAIGSALSRPLTAQSVYPTAATYTERPAIRRSTSAVVRTNSRVSGWLSNIRISNSTSHLPSDEPFYKCQPPPRTIQRSQSGNSIHTLATEMNSPSLTAASSPTTKGHSRSHTGESGLTPVSPATTFYGHGDNGERKVREDLWPIMATTPVSQVGLAF